MTRPFSWFPLAAGDPVPGDPVVVRAAADRYAVVADAIATGARELDSIAEAGAAVSDAVEAVRSTAREVAAQVLEAEDRYRAVAAALAGYAGELDQAQEDSLRALVSAQSAQQALDQAGAQIARDTRSLNDATEQDERAFLAVQLRRSRASRDDADVSLERARHELELAVERRDRAAGTAMDSIDRAASADGLGDGWWENWGSDVAGTVSHVAGTISAVAGIAALFLGWVPVLGTALIAVSGVAGVLALIADVALLHQGEGSLSSVVLDSIGLLTFGIGRALTASASVGRSTLRGVAVTRAARRAASSRSPATRALPAALVPMRLQPTEVAAAIPAWRSSVRAARAEIAELPSLDRIAARAGSHDLVLDMAALRNADKLATGSTLAADALRAAGAVRNAALVSTAAGNAASCTVVGNEYRWVSGLRDPEPDVLGLGR